MYGRQKTFKTQTGHTLTYWPSTSQSKNVQVITVSHTWYSGQTLDTIVNLAGALGVALADVEIMQGDDDYEVKAEMTILETDAMYQERMNWVQASEKARKVKHAKDLENERKEYERLKKKFGDK
jgi:hypothetical protein